MISQEKHSTISEHLPHTVWMKLADIKTARKGFAVGGCVGSNAAGNGPCVTRHIVVGFCSASKPIMSRACK